MTDHTVPPAEPLDKAQLRGVMRPLRRSLPDREPRPKRCGAT
jgi:hypothetical protein